MDHLTVDFGPLTRYFADEHGQEWLGICVPKQFTAKKAGSLGMPCQTPPHADPDKYSNRNRWNVGA